MNIYILRFDIQIKSTVSNVLFDTVVGNMDISEFVFSMNEQAYTCIVLYQTEMKKIALDKYFVNAYFLSKSINQHQGIDLAIHI